MEKQSRYIDTEFGKEIEMQQVKRVDQKPDDFNDFKISLIEARKKYIIDAMEYRRKLVEQRTRAIQEKRRKGITMKMPKDQSTGESPEFKRFRELTRLILKVPKEEIADKLKTRPRKRGKHKKYKKD